MFVNAEEPERLRNFKPTELKKFNGTDDPKIFMAVLGRVYDVTPGAAFYGPQGPYNNFAGRDASRGLAKNSFNEDMLVDTNGPIDKLEDLANDEKMTLMEWASHFQFKYIHIGYLVENDFDGPQYVAPEKKEETSS
ncbi:hypothetical protein HDU85_006082 [Gaertneriomyces sp. JEL0708]|nr:hypothetical protein HDU85_006082 [Gaertneriomyces sp. JEL0708]